MQLIEIVLEEALVEVSMRLIEVVAVAFVVVEVLVEV